MHHKSHFVLHWFSASSLESKFTSGNAASTSTDAKPENCVDESNLSSGPNTRVVKILKQNEPLVITFIDFWQLKDRHNYIDISLKFSREPLSGMKATELSLVESSRVGQLREVDNFSQVKKVFISYLPWNKTFEKYHQIIFSRRWSSRSERPKSERQIRAWHLRHLVSNDRNFDVCHRPWTRTSKTRSCCNSSCRG